MEPTSSTGLPHAVAVKARAVYPTLKRAERAAMDYITGNVSAVISASIVTVAKSAGCSEATLFRLSRHLGYEGFPALKAALARQTVTQDGVVYRGIAAQDSPDAVLQKVFAASILSLQDTLAVLDPVQYAAAVTAVVGARRLLLCGLGDASLVAAAAAQKFTRVDIDARSSEDPDTQLIQASHLGPGDVTIAISHSGTTTTVLNTAAEAHRRGATVVAITNFPHSPLAKAADIVLLTADFAEHLNGEVVSKRVSEQCLLESLYINCLIARNGTLGEAQKRAQDAVSVYKG
jgi:DNA-binding MurR/RpiR family transcriptional regulator